MLMVRARHQVGADGAPLPPEEAGSESSRPHSLHIERILNPGRVELPDDPREPSPPPLPLAPARSDTAGNPIMLPSGSKQSRAPEIKDSYDLQATPKVQLSQAKSAPEIKNPFYIRADPKLQLAKAKRFATGVLEHYNKKKKNKFELLDAKPVISIPEPHCCYTHINFTARSSKEDSEEQLFFAEIYHCSKRRARSGFIVTCCEPLHRDSAVVGQKFGKPEGTSAVRKNADFRHCFACTERMLHPRVENYVAGHCNIPRGYDCMC